MPESMKEMVDAVYEELTARAKRAKVSRDLLPSRRGGELQVIEKMVGTRRLELLTSTVSR